MSIIEAKSADYQRQVSNSSYWWFDGWVMGVNYVF